MTQNQRDMRLVNVEQLKQVEYTRDQCLVCGGWQEESQRKLYGGKLTGHEPDCWLGNALQPQPPAQGEAQALLTDEEIKPFADELHPHSWSKQELGIVRKIAQAQLAKAMTILEQRVLEAVKAEYVSWHPEYTHRRDEPEQFIEAVRQRLSRPQGEYRLPEQNAGIKHPSITPAQPAPTVAPAGGEVEIKIKVVINGQPTSVKVVSSTVLRDLIPVALKQTSNIGRPADQWEFRDVDGSLLNLSKTVGELQLLPDSVLFLNLTAGVGADKSATPQGQGDVPRYRVVDFDEAVKLGIAKEDERSVWEFNHFVVATIDGKVEEIGCDGGEPEDQILTRDWQWVVRELNRAYEAGKPQAKGEQ